jgi:hypothetical protein
VLRRQFGTNFVWNGEGVAKIEGVTERTWVDGRIRGEHICGEAELATNAKVKSLPDKQSKATLLGKRGMVETKKRCRWRCLDAVVVYEGGRL